MGVDVASFGDFFADTRMNDAIKAHQAKVAMLKDPKENVDTSGYEPAPTIVQTAVADSEDAKTETSPRKRKPGQRDLRNEPIRCLTYKDPFDSVYKKCTRRSVAPLKPTDIFTADGKYLLGGMMIGDVSDFVKLVSIVKKRKQLDTPPGQFIIGAKSGEEDGGDLDDDAVVCSCHNVSKGALAKCVREGMGDLPAIKKATKAGSGCGGCVPLVTNIVKLELKKAGKSLSTDLCIHFKMPRADLFQVVKVRRATDRVINTRRSRSSGQRKTP